MNTKITQLTENNTDKRYSIKDAILVCPNCGFSDKVVTWDTAEWVNEGCPDCDCYAFEEQEVFKTYHAEYLKKEPDAFFDLISEYIIDLKTKRLNDLVLEVEEETSTFYQSCIDSKLIAEKEYDLFYQVDIDIMEFETAGQSYPNEWITLRHERFLELNRVIQKGVFGH